MVQTIRLSRLVPLLCMFFCLLSGGSGTAIGQGIDLNDLQRLQDEEFRARAEESGNASGGQESGTRVIMPPEERSDPEKASRIEQIFSARAGRPVRQFGYGTFRGRPVYELSQGGGIQESYVLGPGDEIVVTLRGQENTRYRRRIDRNGQILLPRLAPIAASGRTLADVRAELDEAVAKTFIATEAFIALGEIRQLRILVAGEVVEPGPRPVTGLSTVLDALLLSGGIAKTGSLRNIRILRGGSERRIDLYGVLTGSDRVSGLQLQEGDTVLVPPLGRTIAVVGAVRRPGIYEIPDGERPSARALIDLAGGEEVRGAYRYTLLRTRDDGVRAFETLSDLGRVVVGDSDILFVQPAVDTDTGKVSLRGHSTLAGEFSLTQTRTMADLLQDPSAFRESPYLLFGILSRRDPDSLSRTLTAFSPVQVLKQTKSIPLRDHDIVWILSTRQVRALSDVTRSAELARRERQHSRFVARQGQVQAQMGKADDLGARLATAGGAVAGEAAAGLSGDEDLGERLPPLGAGVRGTVGRDNLRSFAGAQDTPGAGTGLLAPDQDPAPVNAGGAAPELTRPVLAHGLGVDQEALHGFLTDYLTALRGAVRVPGYYFVSTGTSLGDLVGVAGGLRRTTDLATVEITGTTYDNVHGTSRTIRRNISPGTDGLAGIRIQPGDSVVLREVYSERWNGRVNVFGEVRFPGSYEVIRGEKLSSLMGRAGGLTDQAYPIGAIFARRSVARQERESNLRKAEDLQRLIIAQSSRREVNAEQIAFLSQLMETLRQDQPVGRITVEVDPTVLAAEPSLDIELEPGDALYIPSRPSTVLVAGQVLNPAAFQVEPGKRATHYLRLAGGLNDLADRKRIYVIYPDGTSERVRSGFWRLRGTRIIPGSVVVVPYDVTPFFFSDFLRDTLSTTSQLAITAASISAVIAN